MHTSIDLAAIGAPAHLREWRPGQEALTLNVLNSPKRHTLHCAPTGSGKTLAGIATALSLPGTAAFVTATRGLQDQYLYDGSPIGMVDVRGRSNYRCFTRSDWTCADGAAARCRFRADGQCPHKAAVERGKISKLMVTNYAAWCFSNRYSQDGLGRKRLLILDEATKAEAFVAGALRFLISDRQLAELIYQHPPANPLVVEDWMAWCRDKLPNARLELEHRQNRLVVAVSAVTRSMLDDAQVLKGLVSNMETLTECDPLDWHVRRVEDGWEFNVRKLSRYMEDVLYAGANRIMWMSGTLSPYRVRRLQLPDYDYWSYPCPFDPDRFRIIYLQNDRTVRVDFRLDESGYAKLISQIDGIIAGRRDRNGLIATNSFRLQNMILERSKYSRDMIFNLRGEPVSQVVERFRLADPPAVLVSPSVSVGFDFPGDLCRYVIIPKVPYPDTRDPLLKVLADQDKMYTTDLAIQELQQAAGRANRSESDWSEVFILDGHFGYHSTRFRDLYAPHFFRYVRRLRDIPPAPTFPSHPSPQAVLSEDDDVPF